MRPRAVRGCWDDRAVTGVWPTAASNKGTSAGVSVTVANGATVDVVRGQVEVADFKTGQIKTREAMAKLTFRLVPNQDGDKVIALVQEHLQKNCPPGVKLDMAAGHAGPWYLTDPHSKYGEAAQRALKKAFGIDSASLPVAYLLDAKGAVVERYDGFVSWGSQPMRALIGKVLPPPATPAPEEGAAS